MYLFLFFDIYIFLFFVSLQCDRRSALESYFDLLKGDGQSLIALVGCGCSLATEPVAEIANFSDVVHVSTMVTTNIRIIRILYSNFAHVRMLSLPQYLL